jgi:hypothetical protein
MQVQRSELPRTCGVRERFRNLAAQAVFKRAMATNVRPVTSSQSSRFAWRRALNIAVVVLLVVASVAAQAIDLTPLAIMLLIAVVCALAPLFAPTLD